MQNLTEQSVQEQNQVICTKKRQKRKKFQLFPLAREGKGELNCLLSHKKLSNISIKKENINIIFLHVVSNF